MRKTFSKGIHAVRGIASKIAPAIVRGGFKGHFHRKLSSLAYRHCSSRKGEGDRLTNRQRMDQSMNARS